MHQQRVCHRDLKPENLLFAAGGEASTPLIRRALKVADFGLACCLPQREGEMLRERVGSPEYCAPQVVAGRYDEACDLWSCGVILHILLMGQTPFASKNEAEMYQMVLQGVVDLDTEPWASVSNQCKNLVRRLIAREPEQRLTAEGALRHPWVEDAQQLQSSMVTLEEVGDATCPSLGKGLWGCACACQPKLKYDCNGDVSPRHF